MNKKNYELAVRLRHELHEHPEVSANEAWTKKQIQKLRTGDDDFILYTKEQRGKNIAFRADIDALPIDGYIDIPHGPKIPGLSHKCGHDGHAAALAGFALEIERVRPDNNIYLLFQHAEETGDGAKVAAVFIKENNIDEIYAFHNMSGLPFNAVVVKNGVNYCELQRA